MKISVQAERSANLPSSPQSDSSVRLEVVPTQMMLQHVVYLDRAERTEADIQRHIGKAHALGRDPLQQLGGKMQPRRWRCRRADDLGIDGLIALAVGKLRLDVGRKRHFAELLQNLKKNALVMKSHQPIAAFQHGLHRRSQLTLSEGQLCPLVELAAGLDEAFPQAAALVRQQQHLGCAAAWYAVPQKPRRNDARVVHDKAVTGMQMVDELIKMLMRD